MFLFIYNYHYILYNRNCFPVEKKIESKMWTMFEVQQTFVGKEVTSYKFRLLNPGTLPSLASCSNVIAIDGLFATTILFIILFLKLYYDYSFCGIKI